MRPLDQLLRPNIKNLKPYSSARDEYTGEEGIFLDANENPFNEPYNRYPDPYQRKLKEKIGKLKQVDPSSIFLGNGSDEPIDIVYRAFCEPGRDNAVSIDPTYGMYQVAADINNIEFRKVLLTPDFQLDVNALLAAVDQNTKVIFLCSPNNPTGNCFNEDDIVDLLTGFNGMVVLDEAYIDFAPGRSFLPKLNLFPNLIILQTFSKAWGMAGIRLGMAFASQEIIKVLSRIKYPYNLNILTQKKALELIEHEETTKQWIQALLNERDALTTQVKSLPFVEKVYPTDANFILIKTAEANKIYQYLVDKKIIIRDRSGVSLCAGCLRITVGSPSENKILMEALKTFA